LKPAGANSFQDPITKNGWWSGSRCRPSVQTPQLKKKKKKKEQKSMKLKTGNE
jgi:hypothetical protein